MRTDCYGDNIKLIGGNDSAYATSTTACEGACGVYTVDNCQIEYIGKNLIISNKNGVTSTSLPLSVIGHKKECKTAFLFFCIFLQIFYDYGIIIKNNP